MEERLAEGLRLLCQTIETDDRDGEQAISQELWDAMAECRILIAEYDSKQ